MTDRKASLGQAIDSIVEALQSLEESARQTAINAACTHMNLINPIKEKSEQKNLIALTTPSNQTDIRTFKEQKNPKSAMQMACVTAFYVQELAPESARKNSVNANDLVTYFKQANFKLPKAIHVVLRDGKTRGLFESAGGGECSLTPVGYNLVAHGLSKESGD